MYDVIVCGAGPAGSVAATVLARGGARVLLLDRARFPRDKLCGDTINPGALAVLRRDLDAALVDAAVAAGVRFEPGVLVRGPLVGEDGGGAAVRGVILSGADGHDIRVPAPMVIAADGRRSRIAMP